MAKKKVVPLIYGGFKGYYKLKVNEEGTITSKVMDQEGDVYDIWFLSDGGAEIQTEGYTHINLSVCDLMWLAEAVETAEAYYREHYVSPL